MRFKVDENMPSDAVVILRAAGHDAMKVVDQGLGGSDDSTVMAFCRREKRVLVTLDVGFADIRSYPSAEGPCCLVFRLARLDREGVLSALQRVLPLLKKESVSEAIWVIDEWRVRIRTGRNGGQMI